MLRFSPSKLTQLVGMLAVVLTSALPSFSAHAQSQDYPNRSIKFLVPYSAGTTTDVIARLYAQKLGDLLGQTVVVENKAGAGGNISADATAKAAPDGTHSRFQQAPHTPPIRHFMPTSLLTPSKTSLISP